VRRITFRPETIANQPKELHKVLKLVAENSPGKPISVDEMRKRVRILDALDAMGDTGRMHLEEAEYALLKEALQTFPWGQASRLVVNLIDDVDNAAEAKVMPPLREVKEGDA